MRRLEAFDRKRCRGGTLIEFQLIALLLFMIIFAVFEMDRMMLVVTALTEAARAGERYAIVHGSDNSATAAQIANVIEGFASTGILDPTRLNVANGAWAPVYAPNNNPGSTVQITVSYPYDPFTTYFPLTVTLSSTSTGIITY